MDYQELKRPFWKMAVEKFIQAGFKEDDVVPHSWFWEAFGLVQPDADTLLGDAEKAKLLYVGGMTKITNALCVDHQIHLRNVSGEGYRLVPTKDQASTGFDDGMELVKKGLRHATKRLANVNLQALTDQQRAQHSDYCAKLSKLKSLGRSIRHAKPDAPLQIH